MKGIDRLVDLFPFPLGVPVGIAPATLRGLMEKRARQLGLPSSAVDEALGQIGRRTTLPRSASTAPARVPPSRSVDAWAETRKRRQIADRLAAELEREQAARAAAERRVDPDTERRRVIADRLYLESRQRRHDSREGRLGLAIHEAGHAIIAEAVGRNILGNYKIDVLALDLCRPTRLHQREGGTYFDLDKSVFGPTAQERLLFLAGGPAAEWEFFTGWSTHGNEGGDIQAAGELLGLDVETQEFADQWWRAFDRARRVARANAEPLMAVARVLVERDINDRAEFNAAIRSCGWGVREAKYIP